jgi:type II secretory pathway predicted ATPase ExeA
VYEKFYGFTEKPFTLQTNMSLLYMGGTHKAAYSMLEYGLLNQAGFTVITGEIGCGKTTLLARVLKDVSSKQVVGCINHTHENMGELLPWVLYAFGLDYTAVSQIKQYDIFRNFLIKSKRNDQMAVLVVDEAQNLSLSLLEELRTLSNVNFGDEQLLQIILVGQPELRDRLQHPRLQQFVQRIAVDYHIPSLDRQETIQYIEHRMEAAGRTEVLFTIKALAMVYYLSNGVPRVINVICDTVLSYGFADGKKLIDEGFIVSVIRDRSEGGLLALGFEPKKKEGNPPVKKSILDTGITGPI